jgi:hypothetical protein
MAPSLIIARDYTVFSIDLLMAKEKHSFNDVEWHCCLDFCEFKKNKKYF